MLFQVMLSLREFFGFHWKYFQDQLGGLEIQNRNGTWVKAKPIPNTIVINIGDLLEFWSSGRYRATPHRGKNSSCDVLIA